MVYICWVQGYGGFEAVLVLLKNILCSRNERKEVKQELKDVGYVGPCKKIPLRLSWVFYKDKKKVFVGRKKTMQLAFN
jgi:hypothetical protein